jgi:hypothetical protein
VQQHKEIVEELQVTAMLVVPQQDLVAPICAVVAVGQVQRAVLTVLALAVQEVPEELGLETE